MVRLSISEIIKKIELGEIFNAVSDNYSFTLKIDSYVHYVCGAIHDGHQFRKSLWDNCLHSEYDRWFEEDPATKILVQSFPIVITGCDSRFEYDLNREPENAIYEKAWGKPLWRDPLSVGEKNLSLNKHADFYKVVDALIQKLESMFDVVCVYDMHSYNWKRWDREVPTFNIGTGIVDVNRFGEDIESWKKELSQIELPYSVESVTLINDTFKGEGYFLKYITTNFQNTLVLSTELKKIYCDEYRQIVYPEVIDSIAVQLREKLQAHATQFFANHRKLKHGKITK